jgi:enoyl-CoA hydratase/carnithine racemase
MKSTETLSQLKSSTGFTPLGDAVGNLTLGRGRVGVGSSAVPVHMAIVENKIASGSLGVKECEKLASLFRIVTTQKSPLLIYLDSAGAKVSEGLPALGAFRQMYRAAVEMALSGAPVVALLGANCYGGASMVAALAGMRVFSDNTQLAMSGPSILASSAGASALDEAFRAIAAVSIGVECRAKLDNANAREWKAAIPPAHAGQGALFAAHQRLGERLTGPMRHANAVQAAAANRKDLAALFPQGYDATEQDGVLAGRATHTETGEAIALLGLVDRAPLGAARAWLLADRVWTLAQEVSPPKRLNIVVDCEAHSAKLDDEKVMLSSYIADLAVALAALAKRGTYIETTVLGVLGGGVYVALAAASVNVNLLHGAHIQLLPRGAIASILGGEDAPAYQFADYLAARVAEQELRVGFLRQ